MEREVQVLRRSASVWVVAFWVSLAFCFLSVLSLACSLFSFGIVLELQPGWTVWGVFYSYMVAFPLLGIGIIPYFLMIYVKKEQNNSKAGLFIVTIPYVLLLTAIFAYLIFDIIVNCEQNHDAYCWNGLAIRWQYWWVFFSIIFQWAFMILQILFTNYVVNSYQIIYAFEMAEVPTERTPMTSSTSTQSAIKQPKKILFSQVQAYPNNTGMLLMSAVHDKEI